MAPKKPSLTPLNLIAGSTTPPPTVPSLKPPTVSGSKTPPPVAPKTFVPVKSNYGTSSSAVRPLQKTGGPAKKGGDGFQISDVFSLKRLGTELKATGELLKGSVPGLVTLAGGLGADLYNVVLNDFTGKGYSFETSKEFLKGFATTFTPGHYVDYWHRMQNGEAITPVLVQDAGNWSILGSVVAKGLTAGAIKSVATAEAAAAEAAAASTAEAAAQATARATQATERAAKLSDIADVTKKTSRNMAKPMEWSFKPYMWAAKELHTAYKTGAIPYWYDFKNGVPVTWETNLWGQSAAEKYAQQIIDYRTANPDADLSDGNLKSLVDSYNKHSNIGRGSLKAAVIRRAVRDATFDSSQTYRALMQEKVNPAHAKEVNPDTGEVWGELSPVEEQAVIATINGRAQLIAAMADKTGMSPAELAILGRVDWAPELHLSPAAAELAVQFVRGDAAVSEMQYNRLSGAIEGIGKSIVNVTNKSLAGYGRKAKMPLDYTVPTPHIEQLRSAIRRSGNKQAMEIFELAMESEIFDLPLNDPLRRNLIMGLVELLPDEIALDPALYPAIERENLAFFNRVRKAIDNGEVGKILDEPLPEGPFGPEDYKLPRNRGKGSKAEKMIEAGRQKVRKIEAKILKIAEQIDKTEAAHAKKVDLVRRNDMVDAYVNGAAPKTLARKYRMPLSEVEKILSKHPVAKAWREVVRTQEAMASMERVIGKKRAAMGEEAAALEVQNMQAEFEMRQQEAQSAKAKYDSAVQVNEVLRQFNESGLEIDATQHEKLYDDLYDAELELEIAGGNVEDIQIPLDEVPNNGPMTIGRAGAHITELTRRIDEVYAKEAEAISPELAADVQRVKVVMNSSWQIAENAFYDSPTEQATVIAQARIEQLGRLFESVIKGSTDANSLVEGVLRNKETLNIISGATSPFASMRPRVAGKDLFDPQEMYEYGTGNYEVNADLLPVFDINSDVKTQLLNLADEIPPVEGSMQTRWGNKKPEYVNGQLIIDFNPNLDYPAGIRIEFSKEGKPLSIRLEYESPYVVKGDSANISFKIVAGASTVEKVYGAKASELSASLNPKVIYDVINQAKAIWEEYKNNPTAEMPNTIYESLERLSGAELTTQQAVLGSSIRIEFPDLSEFKGKQLANAIDVFDSNFTNVEDLLYEVFGPENQYIPQQSLLSNPKPVEGEVVPVLRAPDVVGAVELAPDLEFYAKAAAEDTNILVDLQNELSDALLIEKSIDDINNPSPETIEKYRQSKIDFHQEALDTQIGFAEAQLGARVIDGTNVKWNLTPIKGAPEWDWWYNLDGRTRRNIARDFFTSTELKNIGAKGPRFVRKASGYIDEYADLANMTIDEFADALLETIDNIRSEKRNIAETKKTAAEEIAAEYSKLNSAELEYYQGQMQLTAAEYQAVLDRSEYLSGKQANPIEIEKLRPIANTPEEVVVDTTITSESVRNAAYEADVLEAMAKDATAKMKKAERLGDRLKAFEEYIAQSEKYRAQAKTLIEKQRSSQKTRLQQIKREEKLRDLREKQRLGTNQARRLTKTLDEFAASEGLAMFNELDRGLPLRTALEPGYPSEQFPVEYLTEEGGVQQFDLSGPMYLPTGGPKEYVGGLKFETTREGLTGHSKLRSEHYRQGDRHTIFSIRMLADKLGKEMERMTLNDKFRVIISHWGMKVADVLGDELLAELQAKAERKAIATPYEILDEARAADLLDADGLQAYNAGLENPQRAFDMAVSIELGKLINLEMAVRGFDAIDPFAPLEQRMSIHRINGDAMYVEKGIKEAIARQQKIWDPGKAKVAFEAMNKVTKLFKTSTLALSVMWQLGDIVSTFIISGMVGVNPADLFERMKQVKFEEYGPGIRTMLDPVSELPPVEGITTIAVESPTQDVGLSQTENLARQGRTAPTQRATRLNRLTRGKVDYPAILKGRRPDKFSFKFNETINRISRHAFFLELFEKELQARGLNIDTVFSDQSWRYDQTIHDLVFEVADSANKWLGDFSDLSMAERAYITPLYPFYAWIKHVHKVFVALGMEHPQSLAWYIYLGTLNYDPNEDPMGLRSGTFGLFGGLASANFLNPLGDIAEGPFSYFLTGDRSRVTRGMGPVPRLVAGLGAGFDIANFRDLERPATSYGTDILGNRVGPLTNVEDILGFTANQFPIIKRGLQTLPQGNIPFTNIATGAVSTYPTGQARLNPYTNEPIGKWGGQPAAIARLFSIPGIPYQTDKQIKQVQEAARKRLIQIQLKQK